MLPQLQVKSVLTAHQTNMFDRVRPERCKLAHLLKSSWQARYIDSKTMRALPEQHQKGNKGSHALVHVDMQGRRTPQTVSLAQTCRPFTTTDVCAAGLCCQRTASAADTVSVTHCHKRHFQEEHRFFSHEAAVKTRLQSKTSTHTFWPRTCRHTDAWHRSCLAVSIARKSHDKSGDSC
jgi:hypothetical protein